MKPQLVRVADAVPTPWKNGGGTTRELLAWPAAPEWIVRISVADINASGPFSVYEGVDRWFAVLSGGDVTLATAGSAPRTLDASQAELHAFAGEAATDCTALGAATQDFNIMLRRARGRLRAHSLRSSAALETRCELAALFSVEAVEVRADGDAACALPGMA
ncbi:MAG: HutD family protein, partial [Proteobacteria bacterium]|nr:HutD family protein [Pseudomonadota bacterium]